MIWCSDFETVNKRDDCRVWCWKSIEVHETEEYTGLTINDFFVWLDTLENRDLIYFHNLKFDGEFIVHFLLAHGFILQKGRVKARPNTFRTLIGDMGQWYAVSITLSNGNTIDIYDSLKIWNFSIAELAPSMGMEISKGDLDYDMYRPVGYEPTPKEWDYIDRDVRIACKAMRIMLDTGYTKMTAGSNALWDYRMTIGKKKWEYWFPSLSMEEDTFIRKSYRGGWTYCNPAYKNQEIGEGIVLDVNSLYPSRMYEEIMPYGEPVYFQGKYKPNKIYPLHIQHINVDFKLKKGFFPTLQAKHSMRFAKTEYITSTNGEPLELTLTGVDMELMFEHYDVNLIEYIDGYCFKGVKGMFNEYIDKWMDVKEKASAEHDKPRRNQAKLFMNSLYGKFAKRPTGYSKFPELSETGAVRLVRGEEEEMGGLYIPVGTFITSYARAYTIRSAQKVHDRFLYADTDSLHLMGTEIPEGLTVHESHLGAWKKEATFHRAMYIGAKCYAEEIYVSRETLDDFLEENPESACQCDYDNLSLLQLTVAGMPAKSKKKIAFADFREGLVIRDKLVPKHVPGGVVLEKTTFEIKIR